MVMRTLPDCPRGQSGFNIHLAYLPSVQVTLQKPFIGVAPLCESRKMQRLPFAPHARRRPRRTACVSACAEGSEPFPTDVMGGDTSVYGTALGETLEMEYEDLVSDEDWVVVDGKDVGKLLDELIARGLDDLGSPAEIDDKDADTTETGLSGNDYKYKPADGNDTANKENEENVEYASDSVLSSEKTESDSATAASEGEREYFTTENLSFMPSWAKEKFLNGEHKELVEGSSKFGLEPGSSRLEAVVSSSREKAASVQNGRSAPWNSLSISALTSDVDNTVAARDHNFEVVEDEDSEPETSEDNVNSENADDADWNESGILDCTANDVALDYNIPVEFVIDTMLFFGVQLPILPSDGIRERLTSEEVEQLLLLVTSFDAMDIADRYSDRTLSELAEYYDLDLNHLVSVCQSEDIYLPLHSDTRLQLTREDRVLDIIHGKASAGQEYPCLMEGLLFKNES